MIERITITPLPWTIRLIDWMLRPLMRFIAGPHAWFEEPQQTHFWNNQKLDTLPDSWVSSYLLRVPGDSTATPRWIFGFVPLFHIPIFGGWKRYVVLEPIDYIGGWHPGWVAVDVIGCSRISVRGPVRLLQCPNPTEFFGVASDGGLPVTLRIIGFGTIGDGGPYSRLPLL